MLAALERSAASPARIRRFVRCGSGFWILRSTTDRTVFRLAADHCHDRWCIPCQRQRAAQLAANVAERIAERTTRLITLTLRHATEPLRRTLGRLYKAFSVVRRLEVWKRHVTGGVAFLEVHRSANDGCWHAHFHILAEGRYFPQSALSDAWLRATGDSDNVHITLVRDGNHAAHYVTKYATKGVSTRDADAPDAVNELIEATTNKRFIVPFGTWARWKLLSQPTQTGWSRYAHSSDLGKNPHRDADLDAVIAAMILLARDDHTMREFTIPDSVPARSPPSRTALRSPVEQLPLW